MIEAVLGALREIRIPYVLFEMDIHYHVREALAAGDIAFTHEAKLGKGCRIDYLAGGVGIEIKKGKPNKKRLMKQLERYLAHDGIESIVVVSWFNVRIPPEINGKRAEQVVLSQLWGVSLP
ncbi:MAG: hypothetical protein JW811_05170 [Clostridiales bacterium]|nr:hypothetical protein [Clostridiales bacterium]